MGRLAVALRSQQQQGAYAKAGARDGLSAHRSGRPRNVIRAAPTYSSRHTVEPLTNRLVTLLEPARNGSLESRASGTPQMALRVRNSTAMRRPRDRGQRLHPARKFAKRAMVH